MRMQMKPFLSRLREIGWAEWDPIGFSGDLPEDEYDTYLLRAAGLLLNKKSATDVEEYLVGIEADDLGYGERATTRTRAKKTAEMIAEYVSSLTFN